MRVIRYTLLSDGSGDRVLKYPIDWLLKQRDAAPIPQWADLRRTRRRHRSLAERARDAVELYPCEVLFVHRDAESSSPAALDGRTAEIREAAVGLRVSVVPVVPVRMSEAWLLFDEPAIRRAAGKPNGREPLGLPPAERMEAVDAKQVLAEALRRASGLTGRRLRAFRPTVAAHRVAELVTDFSPLRTLPAFRRFESELERALDELDRRRND